jgi:ribosomal protein S1
MNLENKDNQDIKTQNLENQNYDENEITMEELLNLKEDDISEKLYQREPVYVKVVSISSDYVYVDIHEKTEGIIPVSDFEGFKLPNIGTKIVVMFERKDKEGNTILSYRKAKEEITLRWLSKVFSQRQRIKGRIEEHVKGGYIVTINGIKAFMPLSLSEIGGVQRHYLPKNAKVKFYVIEFNPKIKKVVVSRRAVLEEDEKIRREKVLSNTKENEIVRAVVSKVVDKGIFVRYQGIEGFVNLEDVDWKKPVEALSYYRRGQRIKVKVLLIDKEKQRITFGIKQTKPNPIDILKKRFPIRSFVKGKVVEVGENFTRIHIIDDVYGIIDEDDYGYDGTPEQNTTVDAVVVGIKPDTFELKLSIKKYEIIENRKTIEHYSKQLPKITLGQLLQDNNKQNS